jgi:hypothetical protein
MARLADVADDENDVGHGVSPELIAGPFPATGSVKRRAMGVWHRARLRNFAETMPRAVNRPDRGVVRAACSLPSRQRRGIENGQHGPELEGCLTSMVRLRNAGRWERPDEWGQERDAPADESPLPRPTVPALASL